MSATGQYAQADYIIQGIGDEVLLGATVLFGFVSVFFVLILNGRKSRGQTLIVHPSARADVETVRQNEEIAQRSNRENLGAENCPICLAAVDNPVETNCAHVFCVPCPILSDGRKWLPADRNGHKTTPYSRTQCFLTLWRIYTEWPQAAVCPICRRRVTLLLLGFEPAPEHYDVLREIRDYNRRMSGAPRPWMDLIRDTPALLRHLFRQFFSAHGIFLVWRIRIIILLLILFLYLLSPLDIIPERVFGIIGFLDDILILLTVVFVMGVIYRAAVLEQQ